MIRRRVKTGYVKPRWWQLRRRRNIFFASNAVKRIYRGEPHILDD